MQNDLSQGQGHNRRSQSQILGQNSDLTYFQHMAFWEIMVTEVESDWKSYFSEHFDAKVLHIY